MAAEYGLPEVADMVIALLQRWEVLVTLGGFVVVWLILRAAADPESGKKKERGPRVPRQKSPPPKPAKPAEDEDADEEPAPRGRRAAAADDDDEVIE